MVYINYLSYISKNLANIIFFPLTGLKILEQQDKILFFNYGTKRYLIEYIRNNKKHTILTVHEIKPNIIDNGYLETIPLKKEKIKEKFLSQCLDHPKIKKAATLKLESLVEELNHIIPF